MHRLPSPVPGFLGLSALLALGGCGSSDSVTPVAPSAPPSPDILTPADSGELELAGPAAQERHAPPSSLTATPGDGRVTLAWNTPEAADGIAVYQLNYGRMGRDGGKLGGWADIEGSDHRTTTHTVTGLANGSEYRFRLRAKYFSGAGRRSERVTATPTGEGVIPPDPDTGSDAPAPPAAPAGMEAHAAGWDRIYLSWNAPVDASRTGWQLRYAYPPVSFRSPPNPWSEWIRIAGADATEYTWFVPDKEELYRIQVRAVNDSGGELVGSAAATASAGTNGGIRPSIWSMQVVEGGLAWNALNPRARPSTPLTVEIRLFEIDRVRNPSVRIRTRKVVPHPPTLTFTPSNWKQIQSVVYKAEEDDDTDDELILIEYYFSGGGDFYETEKSDTWGHYISVTDNDR